MQNGVPFKRDLSGLTTHHRLNPVAMAEIATKTSLIVANQATGEIEMKSRIQVPQAMPGLISSKMRLW